MKASVHALNLNHYESESCVKISLELPAKCPCCGAAYSRQPEHINYFQESSGIMTAYATYFCPACETCFFEVYLIQYDSPDLLGFPITQYPAPSEATSFSQELSTLTPKFVEIYHQAEKAEAAISNHPESKEQIESFLLGKCIADFIDNEKIKTLAKASAWLGNDETHYIRKHQNYNVQDLKRFIKATVAYIDSELSFTEAFAFLNNSQ